MENREAWCQFLSEHGFWPWGGRELGVRTLAEVEQEAKKIARLRLEFENQQAGQ